MRRPSPCDLVRSLDPPDDAVLKREERTVVWRETASDGGPIVAKLYRRRSRRTAVRSRMTRFRVEREYRRLRHLLRWGIPCTIPLDWASGYSDEHGHHEILVMREVPNAVSLADHVKQQGGTVDLAPLYRIARRMHESGFCNQTLYAYNVLVDVHAPPGEKYFIADVPRSWTFPRSIAGTRMALLDLLDLTVEVLEAGVEPEAVPFDAYGLSVEESRRAWAELEREDPRNKRRRSIRDGKARLRWLAEWSAARSAFWKARDIPPAKWIE